MGYGSRGGTCWLSWREGREMLLLNWNNWNDSGPGFRMQIKIKTNPCL